VRNEGKKVRATVTRPGGRRSVGRYRIVKFSAGAMGEVYLAEIRRSTAKLDHFKTVRLNGRSRD